MIKTKVRSKQNTLEKFSEEGIFSWEDQGRASW